MPTETEFDKSLAEQAVLDATGLARYAVETALTTVESATRRADAVTDVAVAGAMGIVTSTMHAVIRSLDKIETIEDLQKFREELSE